MNIRFASVLGVLALLVLPGLAQAQPTKIGYIDPDLILARMPETATVRQQLQQQAESDRAELATLAQEIQTKFQDYNEKQALLSDQARQQREQELLQLQENLEEQQQQRGQALQRRELELMQPLYERLQGAIDEVAAGEGVALVLATTVNNGPVVLYAGTNAVDLTLPVAQRLGIQVQPEAGAEGN